MFVSTSTPTIENILIVENKNQILKNNYKIQRISIVNLYIVYRIMPNSTENPNVHELLQGDCSETICTDLSDQKAGAKNYLPQLEFNEKGSFSGKGEYLNCS